MQREAGVRLDQVAAHVDTPPSCTKFSSVDQTFPHDRANGVLVDEGGVPVDGNLGNGNDLAILDNSPQLDQPIDGQIATLRIFNRPLTPAEITAAAQAQ